MKTVAIVQARTGSTRLPRKVLMDVADAPMLARVVTRAGRAAAVDEVVVATTDRARDDDIVAMCASNGWLWSRGSEEDVLDRYYRAALDRAADVVVRITADCPLIDPGVIDEVIRVFVTAVPRLDYASNVLPRRSFPRGLDTEVFTFAALEHAWREATDGASREHVTPYLYQHPDRFRTGGVVHDDDLSGLRWTVDTVDDLVLVRRIYDHFRDDRFSWQDAVSLLRGNPEWAELNRHVLHKTL